jgi:hypothetical protein
MLDRNNVSVIDKYLGRNFPGCQVEEEYDVGTSGQYQRIKKGRSRAIAFSSPVGSCGTTRQRRSRRYSGNGACRSRSEWLGLYSF